MQLTDTDRRAFAMLREQAATDLAHEDDPEPRASYQAQVTALDRALDSD